SDRASQGPARADVTWPIGAQQAQGTGRRHDEIQWQQKEPDPGKGTDSLGQSRQQADCSSHEPGVDSYGSHFAVVIKRRDERACQQNAEDARYVSIPEFPGETQRPLEP